MTAGLVELRKRGPRAHAPRLRAREAIMAERIRYGSRLSIVLTERCNIECEHCLPECGPKQKQSLTWDVVEQSLRDARALGTIEFVRLTGGEPFLDLPLLTRAIALTAELGMTATVMTNGFWAHSAEKARAVLTALPGLSRLGLSTDTFHQKFIAVDRIIHAVRAAHELGIEVAVRVCHLDEPDKEIELVRQQLIAVDGAYELEHQPIYPIGRARSEIDRDRIYGYDTDLASCRAADMHAINPSGELTACCGATGFWKGPHPLKFGNVNDERFADVHGRAAASSVLHAVRLWGPAGLLRLAQDEARARGVAFESPPITNICELCEFVVTSPERAELLQAAVARPEVQRRIAVARMVDLGETSALEL